MRITGHHSRLGLVVEAALQKLSDETPVEQAGPRPSRQLTQDQLPDDPDELRSMLHELSSQGRLGPVEFNSIRQKIFQIEAPHKYNMGGAPKALHELKNTMDELAFTDGERILSQIDEHTGLEEARNAIDKVFYWSSIDRGEAHAEQSDRNFQAIGQAARKVVEGGHLDNKTIQYFRSYAPMEFLRWFESLDVDVVPIDTFMRILHESLLPAKRTGQTEDYGEAGMSRISRSAYSKLIPKLFFPVAHKGRRKRQGDWSRLAMPIRISDRHTVYPGVPAPTYRMLVRDGDRFFLVRYTKELYDVQETCQLIEEAQKLALYLSSVNQTEKGYLSYPKQLEKHSLGMIPMHDLKREILEMPVEDLLYRICHMPFATIGSLLPGHEPEIQAMIDGLIRGGELVWPLEGDNPRGKETIK